MSRKDKKKSRDKRRGAELWVVDFIDRMSPSDSFSGDPLPFEEAQNEYNRKTENGTVNTAKDKYAIVYYDLRMLNQ